LKTITAKVITLCLVGIIIATIAYNFHQKWLEAETIDIIVVNKCGYDVAEFWAVVYAGMEEASDEMAIELTHMHAPYEYEIDKQKKVIEEAILLEPDVIVLMASDYYEIGPYAQEILDQGIKLLLMDSGVHITSDVMVPFVGTNSLKAGEFLGNLAKSEVDPSEKAIVLAHYAGVQTSDEREAGIKIGFGESRISQTFSCDSDENVAYRITKDSLRKDKDITVIFATNETVTVGAARAIEDLELSDQVKLYGFDGSKKHVQYLEKRIIDYTIIQSPYQMGYLSIINAVKLANDEEVSEFTETDFLLISVENMYDVGFREILFPFVNKN